MEALPGYVLNLIQSDRHGGRTIRTDERTMVLYDCGYWADAYSTLVKDAFPEVDISVQVSQGSLSGFVVVFHLSADRSAYLWAALTVALVALVLLTARQMLASPK
jgi:hypothetical protein